MSKAVQRITEAGPRVAGLPAHELIYRKLRDLVLFGDLAPGQAVTIQGLTERLNAGMTPVREAIRRLISQGALEFQGNRRVCVPTLTANNIMELIQIRQWVDPYLARAAVPHATAENIGRLIKLDKALDTAIARGDLRGYLELNYAFHVCFYQMAKAPIMADLAKGLWLRFGPSLRVVCGRMGTQNVPDNHKVFLEALERADAEAAVRAIFDDVTQGMEEVRRSLHAGPSEN